jgi:hypothetical protein
MQLIVGYLFTLQSVTIVIVSSVGSLTNSKRREANIIWRPSSQVKFFIIQSKSSPTFERFLEGMKGLLSSRSWLKDLKFD